MKTKLIMQMTEALEATRDVEITAVAILSEKDYQNLLSNGELPEQYIDRLNQHTKAVTALGSSGITEYKALLIMRENEEGGLAVCGKDRISFASHFPYAKQWLQISIKSAIDIAYKWSRSDEYSQGLYSYEFIADVANLRVTADNGVGKLVLQELKSRDEFFESVMDTEGFKVKFNTAKTQNKSQETELDGQGLGGQSM